MIRFIISLLLVLKEKLEGIENRLPVSLVTSQSQLEQELRKLGENISKLECVGCKTKIDKEDIRGVYKHKGETFIYCSKFNCEHEAMHKMLS